jgi:ABC-type uncharacterized transport system substrate-binding protein
MATDDMTGLAGAPRGAAIAPGDTTLLPPPKPRSPWPKRITYGLMTAFILLSLIAFVIANNAKPRVLILHSYDPAYVWTRDVNVGLDRVLNGKPFAIRRHYMDTKRHPEKEYAEKAGIVARRAIDEYRPDIIIAIDDDAQRYVAKYYTLSPSIKIVFAGINGQATPYGYDKAKNVTGILERKQLTAVRAVMVEAARAHPTRRLRLAYVGDQSGSVKEDTEFINHFEWAPASLVSSKLVPNFEDWKVQVLKANTEADFLLTTNYRRMTLSATDKRLVNPKAVVKWTEDNAKIPIIGTNGFYVEEGGGFAIATSPFEQGETAAQMAVDIIEKKLTPDKIKVEQTREFIVYMRPSIMKKHDFEVPKVYESFARAMNNYYD